MSLLLNAKPLQAAIEGAELPTSGTWNLGISCLPNITLTNVSNNEPPILRSVDELLSHRLFSIVVIKNYTYGAAEQ